MAARAAATGPVGVPDEAVTVMVVGTPETKALVEYATLEIGVGSAELGTAEIVPVPAGQVQV